MPATWSPAPRRATDRRCARDASNPSGRRRSPGRARSARSPSPTLRGPPGARRPRGSLHKQRPPQSQCAEFPSAMACPIAISLTQNSLALSSCDFRSGDVIRFHKVLQAASMKCQWQGEGASVFLFARDVVASIARPVLELKHFVEISHGFGESVCDRLCPLRRRDSAFPAGRIPGLFLSPGNLKFRVGFSAYREGRTTIRPRALSDA